MVFIWYRNLHGAVMINTCKEFEHEWYVIACKELHWVVHTVDINITTGKKSPTSTITSLISRSIFTYQSHISKVITVGILARQSQVSQVSETFDTKNLNVDNFTGIALFLDAQSSLTPVSPSVRPSTTKQNKKNWPTWSCLWWATWR